YYLKPDAKSADLRRQYGEHMTSMFRLLGDAPAAAEAAARAVMHIETELARASMERVKRRDPHNRDHKMNRAEAVKLTPGFELARYFELVGAPAFGELNVGNPDFFKQVEATVQGRPLGDLKHYLRWQLLRVAAPHLSSPFVNEAFHFDNQILTGQKE